MSKPTEINITQRNISHNGSVHLITPKGNNIPIDGGLNQFLVDVYTAKFCDNYF